MSQLVSKTWQDLVRSETWLKILHNDIRITEDELRDWAIANDCDTYYHEAVSVLPPTASNATTLRVILLALRAQRHGAKLQQLALDEEWHATVQGVRKRYVGLLWASGALGLSVGTLIAYFLLAFHN